MPVSLRVLATGGTIAGVASSSASSTDYQPAALGIDTLLDAVPALRDVAQVDGRQIAAIDSRNASPEFWKVVGRAVQDALDDPAIDGVVVTHGTDTVEETAWYLHLTLKSNKPVVMVAAMRPASSLSADGPLNLLNAARVAADPRAAGRGVMLVLNHQIFGARGTRKTHTMRPDAFSSVDGVLGQVHDEVIDWTIRSEYPHTMATPFSIDTPLVDVEILMAYTGASPALIDAVRTSGAGGLIWAGSGNGSASDDALVGLRRAASAGLVVVRASRTGDGPVHKQENDVPEAERLLNAGTLNPIQARILLMLALGHGMSAAEAFTKF
ncbi:asparaginase [Pigmentiphaga aceris]|uniref:Asparaginase n=1 Tax=Pigmentiphaga aceris TaxID=1940612 RepID=A0A5C0B068_9BURK|nr:asparaginase [Pigmentiphaga aceris]QEI06017.1 asparaginase [Pigmentiphaga aceris]